MGKDVVAAVSVGFPQRREAAMQARWAAGEWRGQTIHASDGAYYTILYQGRPGGGAGPDFRDAVLACANPTNSAVDLLEHTGASRANDGARRIYGDIELHLKASDWRAHGHARDPRYNNLALHVIFDEEASVSPNARKWQKPTAATTTLASGRRIPQARLVAQHGCEPKKAMPSHWPCASFATRFDAATRRNILLAAGVARFSGKADGFTDALRRALATQAPPATGSLNNRWPERRQATFATMERPSSATASWSAVDRALWLALAEGLGYGRDRETLRAFAEALLPSHDALQPDRRRTPSIADSANVCAMGVGTQRVERLRLRGLLVWRLRWQAMGPWASLRASLKEETVAEVDRFGGAPLADRALRRLLAALHVGAGGAVSLGRAIILAANVVLPFAAAWARAMGDMELAALAREVYRALPGAPSNQITREMMRQLGLARAPAGAAAQQGLHHVWATHCRRKQCASCPCAVPRFTPTRSNRERQPCPTSAP